MRAGLERTNNCSHAADRTRACSRRLCAGLAYGRIEARKHDGNGASLARQPSYTGPPRRSSPAASKLAQYGLAEAESVVRRRAAAGAAPANRNACLLKQNSFRRLESRYTKKIN